MIRRSTSQHEIATGEASPALKRGRHSIEGSRELSSFITSVHFSAVTELSGSKCGCVFLELLEGPHDASREHPCNAKCRGQGQAAEERTPAQLREDGSVSRLVGQPHRDEPRRAVGPGRGCQARNSV